MTYSKHIIIALFALAIAAVPMASAQSSFITHYSVFTNWISTIFIAITLGMVIAGIYYLAGVIVNNPGVKSNAITEFGQAVGTGIIVVLLLGIFYIISSSAVSTSAFSPSIPSGICQNYLSKSPLNLASSSQSPTNTICSFIENAQQNPSNTVELDYPLAASYVITANLTTQALENLNSLYVVENYLGFLSRFSPYFTICLPAGDLAACTLPWVPVPFDVKISYVPLAGYDMIKQVTKPLESVAYITFESFVLQLVMIIIVLYAWPYLLAAGIILRSTCLTRKVGGLLMAIAIIAFGVFPLIYLIEYAALSGGAAASSPIGASNLPVLVINETTLGGQKIVYGSNTLNFYVFPRVDWVANNYNCWQPNILSAEVGFAWPYLTPYTLYEIFAQVLSFAFASSIPSVNTACTPSEVTKMIPNIINVYGVMDVTGFIIPVLNILIALAALKGLSQLFGGDTNLLGIGNLV